MFFKTGKLQAEPMESIPPGENPFNRDLDNMGTWIAKNILVMYPTHPTQNGKFVIIVRTDTGDRMKIRCV